MKSQHEYTQKMKAKLDLLDAKIELWEAKAAQAKAESKIETLKILDELKTQRQESKEWLDKVSEASEEAWDSLKEGFEKAYERMKRVF